MTNCDSYRQFCSLGPLPPRTPARADPQVPKDGKLGPCAHGKINSFYFYADGSEDDPAFGFCDIEVSVHGLRRKLRGLRFTALPMVIKAPKAWALSILSGLRCWREKRCYPLRNGISPT